MHSRKKIRDAIYTRLQPHPKLRKLFVARTKPTPEEHLPFANVVTGSETSQDYADQWRELRIVQVMVLLYVQQARSAVDDLDELADVVETLLGADQTLGGVCSKMRYKGCDPDYDSAAAQDSALLTMNYEIEYVWEPSPLLDDFGQVAVSIDMSSPRNDPPLPASPDGQIDAVDIINLSQ